MTSIKQLWYLPLFFIGAVVMRSAGCIINDIFDQDIDRQVERTCSRPLATGALSLHAALVMLILLMLAGLLILLILPPLAIIIGYLIMPIVVIYPLMKRIIHFPQVILGMTFGGIGILIAYATVAKVGPCNYLQF